MVMRFVDRKDKDEIIKKSKDFKLRSHGGLVVWLVYAFIIVTLAITLNVNQVIYGVDGWDRPLPRIEILMSIIFMMLITLLLSGYVFFAIGKLRSIVHAVEFQNAIFSSIAKIDALFCLVVNKEGQVVYIDEGSTDFLQGDSAMDLDNIISNENISNENGKKIKKAINKEKREEIKISFGKKNLKLLIEPISRPEGYFVVRGYKA